MDNKHFNQDFNDLELNDDPSTCKDQPMSLMIPKTKRKKRISDFYQSDRKRQKKKNPTIKILSPSTKPYLADPNTQNLNLYKPLMQNLNFKKFSKNQKFEKNAVNEGTKSYLLSSPVKKSNKMLSTMKTASTNSTIISGLMKYKKKESCDVDSEIEDDFDHPIPESEQRNREVITFAEEKLLPGFDSFENLSSQQREPAGTGGIGLSNFTWGKTRGNSAATLKEFEN